MARRSDLWYNAAASRRPHALARRVRAHLAEGKPFSSDYRFLARDGRVVWVHGDAKVVRDDDGQPLFLQGVAFDITAIKEAEEELEKRVKERTALAEQRAQELAKSKDKVEVFAYTASHDLKEPLRTIRLDTQRLQESLENVLRNLRAFQHDLKESIGTLPNDTEKRLELLQGQEGKLRELFAFILENTGNMDGLLQNLDVYSQVGQEGRVGTVDGSRVFESACNILRAAIEDSGATVTADHPLPAVRGVETELTRLFQNLINNAIKYRKRDQPVQIHVGFQRQEDHWRFSVRDNGIGIKKRYLDGRLFGIGQRSRVPSAQRVSRHRLRSGDLQTHRRESRRFDLARIRVRSGQHVYFHPARRRPLLRGRPPGRGRLPLSRSGGRQFHDREPKILDLLDRSDELIHVNRLGHVAVGVAVVRLQLVSFGARTGHDHDGDALQVWILLDFLEYFSTVHSRQVEIEQDQIRPRHRHLLALTAEDGHRHLALLDVAYVVEQLPLAERFLRQPRVGRAVFHQKDFDGSAKVGTEHGITPWMGPHCERGTE